MTTLLTKINQSTEGTENNQMRSNEIGIKYWRFKKELTTFPARKIIKKIIEMYIK